MCVDTLVFDVVGRNEKRILAFIKNDIVMNIENINIPPNPYKCSVRRPVLSISGIDTSVITTYRFAFYYYFCFSKGIKRERENKKENNQLINVAFKLKCVELGFRGYAHTNVQLASISVWW